MFSFGSPHRGDTNEYSHYTIFNIKRENHPKLSKKSAWGGRVVRLCWVNFQCRGVLLVWMIVGRGPTVLAVGGGGGGLDIFYLLYHFSFFLPLSGRRPDID